MKTNTKKKSPDNGSFVQGWNNSQIMLELSDQQSLLAQIFVRNRLIEKR
jgi:hypothetical protein